MKEILVSKIYDEILAYYRDLNYKQLTFNDLDYQGMITVNGEERLLSPPDEAEALLFQEEAYYIFESEDQKETRLETLRSYLTSHFRYLMQNVLYLDLRKFKRSRTYYISEPNYPIFKEILLRSISQKQQDLIIGRWLNGNISDDSFYEWQELSDRLFEVIYNLDNAASDVKESWVAVLKIALRTDYINTIIEVEQILQELFSNSLPFAVADSKASAYSDRLAQEEMTHEEKEKALARTLRNTANHEMLKYSIIDFLTGYSQVSNERIMSKIEQFLQEINFDAAIHNETCPPVDLLRLKPVCEYLYAHPSMKSILPNADKIDQLIDYFITVDKQHQTEINQRKEKDHNRYQKHKI